MGLTDMSRHSLERSSKSLKVMLKVVRMLYILSLILELGSDPNRRSQLLVESLLMFHFVIGRTPALVSEASFGHAWDRYSDSSFEAEVTASCT